jgi:metal iron transporter
VQARCYKWKDSRPTTEEETDLLESRKVLEAAIKIHLRYSFWDLFVALTFAFFVNCAILIVFSANFFYGSNQTEVGDLFTAHDLLQQYLGPAAAVIFALALLCSGQSSTLTATMAGQIVMSGFLGLTSRPWLRRLVTRLIAIIPAMIAAIVSGKDGINNMLIASQVALSIQLPFAIVPLVVFTGMKRVMTISVYNDSDASTCPETAVEDEISEKCKTDSIKSRPCSIAPSSVEIQESTLNMDVVTEVPTQAESEIKKSLSLHETCEAAGSEIEPLIFANNRYMNVVSGIVALIIIGLNAYLVITLFMGTATS